MGGTSNYARIHQRAARSRVSGPDLGHHGNRRLYHLQDPGHRRFDRRWLLLHRRRRLRHALHHWRQHLAGAAGGRSRGDAGRSGHRPAPHPMRYSRHPGRHPHPTGPVVGEHGHHGHEGQRGRQRDQPRYAEQPAGLPALRAGRGQGHPPLLPPPHLRGGPVHRRRHRHPLLVLRHGAGLLSPGHRLQRQHGTGPGHQYRLYQGAGPGDLQRPGGSVRRPAGPV